MRVTTKEKGLLDRFRKLESQKSRNDVIFQIDAMVRAQEALREDYGLDREPPAQAGKTA